MTRISVSIPDELTARLEPFKDRINVSQAAREALERRIDAFERASQVQEEDLDLEALVARLRQERALVEGKFEGLGRRNAAAWLSSESYLELKDVAENHDLADMDKYKLPRPAFRTMKKDMEKADVSCDGVHAVAYKTAWLEFVRGVWAQIVAQMDGPEEAEPVAVGDEDGSDETESS